MTEDSDCEIERDPFVSIEANQKKIAGNRQEYRTIMEGRACGKNEEKEKGECKGTITEYLDIEHLASFPQIDRRALECHLGGPKSSRDISKN